MGEVVFEQGSLQLGNDIKLFEDHDMSKVRGRMISHEITPVGIVGKFKVARTSAGDDILALAQDGQYTRQKCIKSLFFILYIIAIHTQRL